MPFEPAPQIIKSWIGSPELETALRALSARLRILPDNQWYYASITLSRDFAAIKGLAECGTVGCALGHSTQMEAWFF